MPNAISIANEKGFKTLQILTSMTLDSGSDISEFTIIGASHVNTLLTIDTSADTENIIIKNANVTGTLDGGSHLQDCTVGNLSYVNGHLHNCGLYGTITLNGSQDAVLVNCLQSTEITPIINMGGTGQNLLMTEYSGRLKITNLTGATEVCALGFSSGSVELDSTITGGIFIISGIGVLDDNATSYTSLSTDALLNKKLITEGSWNCVFIDTTNGSSGTDFPLGTPQSPVDNIADAITIAANHNLTNFHVKGTIVLPQGFDGYTFIGGKSVLTDIIVFNGQTISNCKFEQLTLSGTATCENNQYYECMISNVTGICGIAYECGFSGTITLGGAGSKLLGKGISMADVPTYIDMVGDDRHLKMNYTGQLHIQNMTAAVTASTISCGTEYGALVLESSCTGGAATISGQTKFTDNSTTVVVTDNRFYNDTVSDSVLDETLAEHLTAGSTGKALDDASSAGNPWSSTLSGNDTPGTFGWLVQKIYKVLYWILGK